jgi:GGDEF domain-containing protein
VRYRHHPLGGDEFLIALTDIDDAEDASHVAARSSSVVCPAHWRPRTDGNVVASVARGQTTARDILLQRADGDGQAKAGRNTYRFFTAEMNAEAMENLRMHAACAGH